MKKGGTEIEKILDPNVSEKANGSKCLHSLCVGRGQQFAWWRQQQINPFDSRSEDN